MGIYYDILFVNEKGDKISVDENFVPSSGYFEKDYIMRKYPKIKPEMITNNSYIVTYETCTIVGMDTQEVRKVPVK